MYFRNPRIHFTKRRDRSLKNYLYTLQIIINRLDLREYQNLINSIMKTNYFKLVLLFSFFVPITVYSSDNISAVSDSAMIYDITYKTEDAKGNTVSASGIIMIPQGEGPFPIISIQHGTIFSRNVAPSYFDACPEAQVAYELAAKLGYIVVMADYVGLGKEGRTPHPYFHSETEASATLDMLRAALQFLNQRKIKYDERLFLAGYSQGGHVTAALQRFIEGSAGNHGFTIAASAIMAAPFDLYQLWVNHFNNPVSISSSVTSLMVKTYTDIYETGNSYSDFFNAPYDKTVTGLLDYQHAEEEVIKTLNMPPKDIFKKDFSVSVVEGKHKFAESLNWNKVYNWAPKSPTIIVYSKGDEVVNHAIVKNAYMKMKESGGNVTEIILANDPDHANGFVPAIQEALNWFSGFRK